MHLPVVVIYSNANSKPSESGAGLKVFRHLSFDVQFITAEALNDVLQGVLYVMLTAEALNVVLDCVHLTLC